MGVSAVAILLALGTPTVAISADPAPPESLPESVGNDVLPSQPAPDPIDKRRFTLFDPTPRAALRDFTTDRPDVTESPITVDAGHVQVELSLADYAFDRDGATRTRTTALLPVNVKLGLTNAADIQIVFTPYQYIVTRDGSARSTTRGFGDDTEVRLKVNLWGNDGGRTAFAVMPFVKLPTGAGASDTGHVEGGLILPLAIDLPAGFSLGTMAEFDLTYDEAGGGGRGRYGIDVVHSVTLGHPLLGKLDGYVEYVGVAPRRAGGGYRATASSGLTYDLAPGWNIDAGGTFGLSGRTDDATLFVGTSVRF